ncbi:hypothetical protein ANSO36C_09540 [Nostoc cf. commune SO-36]|uniref:DUF4347 domain-containing protein n=1 Tax=Nostoc cf. commune SO-36 TaxID=449208 RepID=A0ABN6PZG9_NOSCO|nr:DUF4347 domain-containing protein [Nostoc commune]BDI15152.1 hypothetical protein ANSO36C_09540 [Nostoc cf. commune SO-36]
MNNNEHSIFETQNHPLLPNPLAFQDPFETSTTSRIPGGISSLELAEALDSSRLEPTNWVKGISDPLLKNTNFNSDNSSTKILYQNIDGLIVGQLQIGDVLTNSRRTTQTPARELVFIDAGVENSQQILSGVNPLAEVVYLNDNEDGVEQISQILRERQNIGTIHIVSHGDEAKLQLGTTSLNSKNLKQYAKQIRGWGDALTDTADILVYGCDIAAGNDGKKFVTQLSRLTGADVAASDNLTGASNLGGDWELEYTTGSIEANTLTSDYHQVLFTPTTIQELYNAWRSNTLPDLSSIQLKLDSNSVLNGTVTIASNDSNLLKLTGTNLSSSIGTGLSTADSSDDKGFNFTNATLNLSLNADFTYTYSLSGQAALNNFAELTLSADNITATGTQDGTTVNLTNFQLGVGNVTRLSGSTLVYNAENEQLNFAATNTSAFIGHGANTPDTNDNTGLTISNGTFNLSAISGQSYTYEVSSGLVSLTGSSTLSFSADGVTATGNASNTTVTLNNYALKVDDVASLSGTTLEFSAEKDANGLSLTLAGENVNGFIGYGAATNDTADDVGVAVSDVGFSLTLNSDKTYDYSLSSNSVVTRGIDGLTLLSQNVTAVGNQNSINFTTGVFELSLGDLTRISGESLLFTTQQTANGKTVSFIADSIAALIGYGANTVDITDDVGLSVANADITININANKTYDYSIINADIDFTGIDGLTLSAQQVNIIGDVNNSAVSTGGFELGLGNIAWVSGDALAFKAQKTADGKAIALNTTNISALIGYGTDTETTADDLGISVTNGNLNLGIKADKTYNYNLTNANVAVVGIDGVTLSANTINASGDHSNISLNLSNTTLGLDNFISLSGASLEFQVADNGTDKTVSFIGADLAAFTGFGAETATTSDDVGLDISNADLNLQFNADNTYSYNLANAAVAVRGIPELTLSADTVNVSGDHTGTSFNLSLNNAVLGLSNLMNLNAASLKFTVEGIGANRTVTFKGEDLSAFVGYGAESITTSDDIGLAIANADFDLRFNGDNTYRYSLENASIAVRGIDGLTLSADAVNATGDGNNTLVSLTNAKLGLGNLLSLSGASLEFNVEKTGSGKNITFNGENLSAFAGYGAATSDTSDDIGLAISNADLDLVLNADKTYFYKLDNADVAVSGINGLALTTESVSATGDKDNLSVSTGSYELALGNVVRVKGDALAFSAENGQPFTFNTTNASALVGYGANTTTVTDDIGLSVTNANLDVTLNTDKTYNYSIANANASLLGVDGLTLTVNQVNITGDQTNATVATGSFKIGVDGVGYIQGDGLAFDPSKNGTDPLRIAAIGVEAFVGAGGGTDQASGIQLSNGDLGLVIFANDRSSYALVARGEAVLLGTEDLTLEGSLALRINYTGQTVNETIALSGGNTLDVVFGQGQENQLRVEGTVNAEIAGNVAFGGEFSMELFKQKTVGAQNVTSTLNNQNLTLAERQTAISESLYQQLRSTLATEKARLEAENSIVESISATVDGFAFNEDYVDIAGDHLRMDQPHGFVTG